MRPVPKSKSDFQELKWVWHLSRKKKQINRKSVCQVEGYVATKLDILKYAESQKL